MPMKSRASLVRARQLSLVILIGALIEHASFNVDFSGSTPGTLGLARVSRDLHRKANREFESADSYAYSNPLVSR
jgi:hypothetical protein